MNIELIIGLSAFFVLYMLFYFVPVGLWISANLSNARVGIGQLIAMRLRRVDPKSVVDPMINSVKAGLKLKIGRAHV